MSDRVLRPMATSGALVLRPPHCALMIYASDLALESSRGDKLSQRVVLIPLHLVAPWIVNAFLPMKLMGFGFNACFPAFTLTPSPPMIKRLPP